ncbi:MAG: hypothetical protein PF436_14185 [Prolixibacteraceae bacterium]|jgi:hypothetical protein|nr:hypothetical protein [Prolixibacteraceae bacterium]
MKNLLLKSGYLCLAFILLMLAYSCTPTKCVLCDIDNSTLYKVELDEDAIGNKGNKEIETFFTPVPIEVSKKKVDLYLVDCTDDQPYKLTGESLEQFIKQNMFRVDTSQVKRIVTTSDADVPPEIVRYSELEDLGLCNRARKLVKIELRGMLASRRWDNEGMFYTGYNGGTFYERNDFINQVIGFGRGGTNLILGAEAAIIPRVARINNRHAVGLGLLTGFWPVDGGLFIPISFHPRFTFNEFSAPLWGKCNAWYLFGDLGAAYDASGGVPFIIADIPASWFTGGGVGIDLWKTKNRDLSFDIGYRYTSLAMPINDDLGNCYEAVGIDDITNYPRRNAGQFFVRLGFTW